MGLCLLKTMLTLNRLNALPQMYIMNSEYLGRLISWASIKIHKQCL